MTPMQPEPCGDAIPEQRPVPPHGWDEHRKAETVTVALDGVL